MGPWGRGLVPALVPGDSSRGVSELFHDGLPFSILVTSIGVRGAEAE
jgi:hypothetical protein